MAIEKKKRRGAHSNLTKTERATLELDKVARRFFSAKTSVNANKSLDNLCDSLSNWLRCRDNDNEG